jgi:hypothetical protein
MTFWSHPRQLRELADFYDRARATPLDISDQEFLEAIRRSFWPTNCGSFVEAAFAIIAPGCAMRPHLVRELIAHPIKAMIAGGLEDPNEIVALGIACATKDDPYVAPTPEGKRWLLEEWPAFGRIATEVFENELSDS